MSVDVWQKMESATHAFICVYDGTVKGVFVDIDDESIALDLLESLRAGAKVERIPIEDTRQGLLFKQWPPAAQQDRRP